MNIAQIKERILISDFLNREGFKPQRYNGITATYKAPYRADRDGSLVVNDKKGVWFDHGEGKGGTIIELGLLLYNTQSVESVVGRINRIYNDLPVEKIPNRNDLQDRERPKPHEVVRTKPLGNNFAISSYLQSRGILDEAVRSKKVVEVYYDHIRENGERKRYFGAGWKNESGGFDIRSKFGKICIDKKDVLIMNGNSGKSNVFEGMINFLSALKEKTVSLKDTNIVMNTLSLSGKTIDKLKSDPPKELNLFLDNGTGGNKFTELFRSNFPSLVDRRDLYSGFEDYNEKIMADLEKKTISYSR
ncbi:hypothetical protein [Olivibacter sitiensis]|uniref:hypothetical protein n=1 Tax=Olivibacter sitiensis TaxID=376470 RepID=UPI00041A891A|nr:hypothetical protein [Olivibacter sitiensis]